MPLQFTVRPRVASQEDYCRARRWDGRREEGGGRGYTVRDGAAKVSEEVGQVEY